MRRRQIATVLLIAALALLTEEGHAVPPGPQLIAIGTISGTFEDFAIQTAGPLENLVPGNRLGGIGSGFAYMGGDFFLALPDRGPNAVDYNDCGNALDDTTSYIPRFHTLHLSLAPSAPGSTLPFTLTPMLVGTTLFSSHEPLVYGAVCAAAGSGAPALNAVDHTYYFSGRSDNFDPGKDSLNFRDARLDPESIRVSRNRHFVYISDEYGPYVYEFDRKTGRRTKAFVLPEKFAVKHLSAHGDDEISFINNLVGRIANKGMEGLAITPDGKLLVGAMQSALEQDGGDLKGQTVRIVTIDIGSGKTREYAYHTDDGVKTTVSDIVAVNNHQFLVDERDGKGLGDNSSAVFKKLYLIDLQGAIDVSALSGKAALTANAVPKLLFLDIVHVLNVDNGVALDTIPAKLEGIAFGQDVTNGRSLRHTLYVTNDNDFLAQATKGASVVDNPNQFFVFAFDDNDLPDFVPQQFTHADDDD